MSARRSPTLRGVLLVAIALIWLAISGIGGSSISKLSTVTENDPAAFLPRSAESIEAKAALEEFRDSDTLPALVTVMGDGVTESALPAGPPRGMPGAEWASEVVDAIDVDGTPLRHFLADEPIPVVAATDDSGVLMILPLRGEEVNAQDADGHQVVRHVVAAIREQAPAATDGATVHVAGPAGFITDLGEAFGGIDGMLLLVTFAAVLVILLIVYRSIILPLLVLLAATAGLSLAGGITFWLADRGWIQINGQAQGILFILVVGAATDYSLLVVARYREELTRHDRAWAAVKAACRACLEPIAASGGTVILGLLCLLLASLNSSRFLGPVGVIAVVSAMLAALTFLPVLLMLGRWIFWPRIPQVTADAADTATERIRSRSVWWRVTARIENRPRVTGAIVLVALLAGGVFVPTFHDDGTRDSDIILADVDSKVGQAVIDEKFDLGSTEPVRIVAAEGRAEQLAADVAALPDITAAEVTVEPIDGRVVVEAEPTASDPESSSAMIEAVRAVAHEVDGTALVGGADAENHDTIAVAQRDLLVIVPAVLAAVLIVLGLLLRSIMAGALLTLATVVSFATALGTAALVFNHVFRFPGADPTVPLLGFVFLVALGVDYSIFLMSRVREEVVAGRSTAAAMKHSMATTGGVITSAGIVLAATFAALAVLPILFLAQLAFIVSFGVLIDTFIVRTLLVPAWTLALGRRVWWPSHLGREDRQLAQ